MSNLNYSIRIIALVLVTAVGMMGCCKKNKDLGAAEIDQAKKALKQNFYAYIEVDSTALNITIREWKLEDGENGKVGYYRVVSTGNGLDEDASVNFTWSEPTVAADLSSVTIPIVINGEAKTLVMEDGVVNADGFVTKKSPVSLAGALRSLNSKFANLDFVYNDTINHVVTTEGGADSIIGPSLVINCEMVFNRADKANTGKYVYRRRTWTKDFYLNPNQETALSTDSLFEITSTKWTITDVTDEKEFAALLFGRSNCVVSETKAGKKTRNDAAVNSKTFCPLQLSGFENGEVTIDEKKFKLK